MEFLFGISLGSFHLEFLPTQLTPSTNLLCIYKLSYGGRGGGGGVSSSRRDKRLCHLGTWLATRNTIISHIHSERTDVILFQSQSRLVQSFVYCRNIRDFLLFGIKRLAYCVRNTFPGLAHLSDPQCAPRRLSYFRFWRCGLIELQQRLPFFF